GARLAREALVAADVELVVGAAEGAAEPRAPAGALQDGQVEVAHVPAGQHAGVAPPQVGEEALEERALVGHRLGARDLAPRDHEDALAARARQGERVEPLAVEGRPDVEREHAEPGRELRRRERGVPVDATHARAALEVARNREGPADAVVDQVAVRETQVGLEAVDVRLAEAAPHRGHVAGERHLDAHDGLAAERAERARHEAHAWGEPAHLGLVGGAYEKVRREPVLAAARAAEREIAAGAYRGLLHGIPVSVKDLIDTAGLRTTYGSGMFRDHVPEKDGGVPERLRAAGAIITGKSATHELGQGITTNNYFFGPTRNPWNPEHVPGGSSGGAGAATAALMGPLHIGTDGGGSIRFPAAFCGVTGLKPTLGLITNRGQFGG